MNWLIFIAFSPGYYLFRAFMLLSPFYDICECVRITYVGHTWMGLLCLQYKCFRLIVPFQTFSTINMETKGEIMQIEAIVLLFQICLSRHTKNIYFFPNTTVSDTFWKIENENYSELFLNQRHLQNFGFVLCTICN